MPAENDTLGNKMEEVNENNPFCDPQDDPTGSDIEELLQLEKNNEGSLALILLLDQFTRNVYRGEKLSFSGDKRALDISLKCIKKGYLKNFNSDWCQFALIPMMHSEDLNIQNQSLPLFLKYTKKRVYDYAIKHQKIISRFNRSLIEILF